ncbi:MAG: PAS domain-containing protein [Verrucomicrobia bacterium]|nr:PAS domain-containing protein [Verrucomicrobiota bacterium]
MPPLLKQIRPLALVALSCVAWFNAAFGGSAEAPGAPKKTVLVLYGERLSIPAMRTTEQGLMSALPRELPPEVEVYFEYLDFARFPAAQYGDALVRYLRARYATRKPDVVIAVVSSALQFALAHRDELFADAPIVFSNVDHREVEGKPLPPNVVGLWMEWDYQRTVELALRLQPETREIVCVSGTGALEQLWNEEARKVLGRYAPRVRTRWLDQLPLRAVLEEVARLPRDSVVLFVSMLRDGAGESVLPYEVARQLAKASRVPVYGLAGPLLEQGILGGALLDFTEVGRETVALARRVLAGERPPVLSPPDPAANPVLINWRALKKWRLSEGRIPAEAAVRYRAPSLWQLHPRLILATAAALCLQSLLILRLIVQGARRKRAERSLRDSEERMTLAAEAANLGLWMWDIPHDDVWATEKCRSLFGFEPGERLDFQRFMDRVHPEDREPMREAVQRALQSRRDFDTEYRLLLADGSVRWIGARGHAASDPQDRPGRLLGVSIDVTARKFAQLQLQQQRDELAHLSRVTTLGEVAATLAHELNQPLAAIHSNAEAAELFLQKDPPDFDELRAILSDIRQDGWRAGEVIHRMRSLLQKRPSRMERIEVKGLVKTSDGLLQGVVTARQARLRLEVAPVLPLVWGDAVQLQQVLLNLVLNALEAMADCPIAERQVAVRAGPDAAWGVEVTVSDRGPGFCREKLAKWSEPFFTTKKHGMGMGLAICQRIIEAHGGRLTAENNPERGATVRFTLPSNDHKQEQPA